MSEMMKPEQQERFGRNVTIDIKFMRHGQRDKEGNLITLGRTITRKIAKESGITSRTFDAVKAIGSDAKPKDSTTIGRALETADIYANEIAGDEQFMTRLSKILNYETLKTEAPYNHTDVYNANLPDNFTELQGDEYVAAAKKAQTAVVNHLIELNTPEAIDYKKEIAGSFAYVIKHYEKMAPRLYSGSKVLIPAGTHGGLMEFLLQEAMVREENGKKIIGFSDINDIGGEFDPSDSYDVNVETDQNGKIKDFTVKFDNPNRPQGTFSLDIATLDELAEFYESLHPEL